MQGFINTFGKDIIPDNDAERVAAVKRYQILDTPREHAYDNIARLATQIFNVPVSLISIVDTDRVFFKAHIGIGEVNEASRGVSLCSLAILSPEVTVFENAPEDPCLLANPHVAQKHGLKFYAGAPLITHDGYAIGTICIVDFTPRKFSKEQEEILKGLAAIVIHDIELRLAGLTSETLAKISAAQELERLYEQVRLSKEAALLGTFDMDLLNGTMEWDERCRVLFGISHKDEVSYEKDFLPGLHPEDRERISRIIDNLFIKKISNGDYDVEYRTVGAEDKKIRWVRAKGKVFFNDDDVAIRFIGSVLEITDQKENELRKNDFIGMVSHELKTPLTSLSAIIQVAHKKLENSDDSFLSTAMQKAVTQVKKMAGMVNGFLNISRLESGKIQLDMRLFDICGLIEEIIAETHLTSDSITIQQMACTPVQVMADREKTGSVIANLLSNAIKYSHKGEPIIVGSEVNGDEVIISVKDNGMGIAPEDLPNLFDRFYRVENPNTRHIAGFGIGLYLSAEIIKQHNGRIWVESKKGAGSTFYFSLPL